jgi:hypothetical protein
VQTVVRFAYADAESAGKLPLAGSRMLLEIPEQPVAGLFGHSGDGVQPLNAAYSITANTAKQRETQEIRIMAARALDDEVLR